MKEIPEAVVFGEIGRAFSFEIKVNDVLIYSKLKNKSFPQSTDVIILFIFKNGIQSFMINSNF